MLYIIFFLLFSCSLNLYSGIIEPQNTTSIPIQSLPNFSEHSEPVKKLLMMGLDLSTKKLGYFYGSSEPINGGMDCSGTVYYLLSKMGIKDVPRSSDLIYKWALEKGHFYPVTKYDFSSVEFSHLRPGDLLFWSGTYEIKREYNVTHVMFYLGKNIKGEPLMVGASNGRSYNGEKVFGVSVFDFRFPDPLSNTKFLGYSCTPQINCEKKELEASSNGDNKSNSFNKNQ